MRWSLTRTWIPDPVGGMRNIWHARGFECVTVQGHLRRCSCPCTPCYILPTHTLMWSAICMVGVVFAVRCQRRNSVVFAVYGGVLPLMTPAECRFVCPLACGVTYASAIRPMVCLDMMHGHQWLRWYGSSKVAKSAAGAVLCGDCFYSLNNREQDLFAYAWTPILFAYYRYVQTGCCCHSVVARNPAWLKPNTSTSICTIGIQLEKNQLQVLQDVMNSSQILDHSGTHQLNMITCVSFCCVTCVWSASTTPSHTLLCLG